MDGVTYYYCFNSVWIKTMFKSKMEIFTDKLLPTILYPVLLQTCGAKNSIV